MARSKELIQKRNSRIKQRFNELTAKHPQWRYDAILQQLSQEYFISPRTVAAILNEEASYSGA